MILRIGSRLRSAVCEAEVVVVRSSGGEVDLRCGGRPMLGIDEPAPEGAAPDSGFAAGVLLGKRYVDADGSFELLCTKPGAGSLAVADEPLGIKDAKPLPSSD
ncbi:hypothetical protein [Actinomadura chibensis]|uniref:Uncharacterized protein n=1 Tax=Actinomadura chibensis TaxID=392828 RepID=A0A5D0NDJ2_9ACTN|nr:hypothetical protein [Actinomadura chibensis]TYB42359.1 hypothetical protein FXF69_31580 [Actinomadura chibensis]